MSTAMVQAQPHNTPWVAGYAYETYQQPPQKAKLVGKIMVWPASMGP